MSIASRLFSAVRSDPGPKPRDNELDLCGLTHIGKVRRENQDHFLICTVHRQVVIHATSLSDAERMPLRGERLATIMLVADGVGGSSGGHEASRLAVESITRYLSSTMRSFTAVGKGAEQEFVAALRAAALEAHAAVIAEAGSRPELDRMATTLTLALVIFPRMYVVQVGDSRCYHCCNGVLRQVTRDQTLAESLVARGALRRSQLAESPFAHVLVSSIGGGETAPEITPLEITRGTVVLLCSDGLTKHVSDDEIAEHLCRIQSSEQVCRALLDLALERGGTDNITVLVGRARDG